MVPVLIAVLGGFSLDLWTAIGTRGRIAAIADQAAAAGATAIAEPVARGDAQAIILDPVMARDRALAAVDGHPDVALVQGRSAAATPELVSVTVEGRHDFLLLRLIGATSTPVVVTGHAAPLALE